MKKTLTIALALMMVVGMLLTAGCGAKPAEAAPAAEGTAPNPDAIKLVYTHFQPGTIDQPKQAAALAFESYVEQHTNGAIDVVIYPNSELGDGTAVLEAMQQGTIQMTVVHDGPLSALYAPMGVYNLPFLFNSHAEAWMIYDGEYTKWLGEKFLENTGLRLLGMADNGVRHLLNSVRPIEKLEDAEGLTIRIQESVVYQEICKGLKANSVVVPWSEMPAALQQGIADGCEMGLTNILASGVYDTQKYCTLDGHVYSYHAYVIDDKFFSGLTEEQQQVIQDGVYLAQWIHRGTTAYQDDTITPVLTELGVKVTTLSPEELQRWREATQPAVAEWMKGEYGAEVVDKLMEAIDAIR